MSIEDVTLTDLFLGHCRKLLLDTAVDPAQRLRRVAAAAKELESSVTIQRRSGRPTLGEKALERERDPLATPLTRLLHQYALDAKDFKLLARVRALSGDPAAPYLAELGLGG